MPDETIAVVGCGVVGLATAILAHAAGYRVSLYADRPPMETTSAKAAASFKPVEVDYTPATHRLLRSSWEEYARIVAAAPDTCGVRPHVHWDAASTRFDPPPYLECMDEVEALERPHVPGGYAFAYRYRTFFVDTAIFLPWLAAQVQRLGIPLQLGPPFGTLDELAALPHDVVVNCTGLGARELCGDADLVPVKGQIVVVGPQPALDWSIKADGFYVYPRAHDTVLGGTAEWNVDDETVEHGAVDAILRANRRILPHLDASQVHRTYAGRRPYRVGGIRVEKQELGGRAVVHHYGHGGAGFTLCWGSAHEALALLR